MRTAVAKAENSVKNLASMKVVHWEDPTAVRTAVAEAENSVKNLAAKKVVHLVAPSVVAMVATKVVELVGLLVDE